MGKDTTYVAIIGDMRKSKELLNRAEVQEKLQQTLEEVNNHYSDHISSEFIITLGDEFQGVLTHIDVLFDIIEYIELGMNEYSAIRFGIGVGKIVTSMNKKAAIGADGPAYHRARDMLAMIKNEERSNKGMILHMMIFLDTKQVVFDMLTAYLGMISWMKESWTDRQKVAVYTMSLEGGRQIQVAKKIGIHQTSLQRRLSAAGYYNYIAAKRALVSMLTQQVVSDAK